MQKERDIAIAQRDRLDKIRPDGDEFLSKLKNERLSIYKVGSSLFKRFFTCLVLGTVI